MAGYSPPPYSDAELKTEIKRLQTETKKWQKISLIVGIIGIIATILAVIAGHFI